jgi:site-specific recombinase XerD
MTPLQHTLGHLPPCPGCLAHEVVTKTEISRELLYAEAAEAWIKSREFTGGNERVRYLRGHSLRDLRDYHRPLQRFFGKLKLGQIRWGNLRQYQFERGAGLLGPTPEDLFPIYLARVARALNKTKDQVQADPQMLALVHAQIEALPQREVGPNKINQELGMLKRLLERAGAWTPEMEEHYEPLQHEESDIRRALSPEEQEIFLQVAQARQPFVHKYSIVGIDCTLSTIEEREIKLGDINLTSRILLVRAKSAKNKYRIRTIPISEQAAWALEGLIERAGELGSHQPQHYLMPFMAARGEYDPARPMTVSGIKKTWDDVRRQAGVPWFTPYGLRHTGCTRYAEQGMAIHVLLSFAGHMSRRTQEHYIHISEQAKMRAVRGSRSTVGYHDSTHAGTAGAVSGRSPQSMGKSPQRAATSRRAGNAALPGGRFAGYPAQQD